MEGWCDMKEKVQHIIDALEELQADSLQAKSARDELYWVDHFIENAKTAMRRALKELEK
jgi:hypothetical protein